MFFISFRNKRKMDSITIIIPADMNSKYSVSEAAFVIWQKEPPVTNRIPSIKSCLGVSFIICEL